MNGQVSNNNHQNQIQHQQNRQTVETKNNTNSVVSGSDNNSTNSTNNNNTHKGERPLKCLETLAQKAGITFDEKYDNFVTLEKSQSPAQVQAPQAVPLQISQEHLQQLQHYQQIQQFVNSGGATAIQVKQEFGSQQQNTGNNMQADMKQQMDASQAAQQQMQQQMQVLEGAPGSPHQSPSTNNMNQQNTQQATQINTMQQLQAMPTNQLPAEWAQRVQLLPSPIQNSGYLQGLYTTTPQVLMGSNLIPSGLGQQQIQVITAGKPFPGGQLGPQMLATTAQGKQVIGSSGGSFGNTYAMPSSQAQTLLFSPVSVISSQPQQQQTNILTAAMAAAPNNKQQTQQDVKTLTSQKILQKVAAATTANGQQNVNNGNGSPQTTGQQCVQVSQGIPQAQILSPIQQPGAPQMQFTTPWNIQGMPQFWTTNGLQSQVLASNPIIFRGTQADGTQGMFIQHNPQTQQTIQTQQHNR